jgi:cytochrome bd-type quinol oxidase subunit 2
VHTKLVSRHRNLLLITNTSRNEHIQLAVVSKRVFRFLYASVIPAAFILTGELAAFLHTNSASKGDLAVEAGLLLFAIVLIMATIAALFMLTRRVQMKQRYHRIEILWISLSLLPICIRFSYFILYRFGGSFIPSKALVYIIVQAFLVIYMEVAIVILQLVAGAADESIGSQVAGSMPLKLEMK